MPPLDTLLVLQQHDTALDRLRYRRASIPERSALAAGEARVGDLMPRLLDARARRDEVAREERRLDDEARALEERAMEVEKRLYSGEVSSPRELQAMQADIEQLRRHRSSVEDEELAQMERREVLDSEVGSIEAEMAVIDEELARERAARDELVASLPADLVAVYERCRSEARGVGVARLVGRTCQGCHLDIPATEAEQIKRRAGTSVAYCDNCGCILVPA